MISCSLGLVVPRAYCSASRSNGAAGKTALHEKEITVSCSVLSYPWPPRSAWRLPYRPALIRMTQGSAPLAEGCSAPVREPRSADWQVRTRCRGGCVGRRRGRRGRGCGDHPAATSAGVLRTAAAASAGLLPATVWLLPAAAQPLLRTTQAHAVQESPNTATGAPRTGASVRNSPPMVGWRSSSSAGRPSRSDVT